MTSERDPIDTLIKASGRRPEVPAARKERVLAAFQDAWRGEVIRCRRRRRIVRTLWLTAAIVPVAAGILALRAPIDSDPSGLVVARVEGPAWQEAAKLSSLRPRPALRSGSSVARGVRVMTASGARIALRASSGLSLRLDRGSALRVLSDRHVALERGGVYIDSGAREGTAGSIRIETPLGSIEDTGTQFEVRLTGSVLSVRVREGEVTVAARERSVRVEAGRAIAVDGTGSIEESEISAIGEGWAWVETVVPPFEIEQRSLHDFLAWAARERGVEARFASAALGARASSILLHGSVANMSLDEAVASVAEASGVTCRFDGDALVVGGMP